MMLFRSIGVVPEPNCDDPTRALLLEGAFAFLRARGTVSLSEWNMLTADSKAALTQAGKSLDVERSVWTGLSSQSPQQAAQVMALIDGGDAASQLFVDTAVSALKDSLKGVEVPDR